MFRQPAHSNLREDRVGQGALSVSLQLGPQGPAAQSAPGRPDQTVRQPEERRRRHQEPQVVRHHRLDIHLRETKKKTKKIAIVKSTTFHYSGRRQSLNY